MLAPAMAMIAVSWVMPAYIAMSRIMTVALSEYSVHRNLLMPPRRSVS